MKEFNDALERLHPDDDTIVRSALLLVGNRGWVVQYDVGADMAPWIMNVVAGHVKWAHPVDYDVTQVTKLKSGTLDEVLDATENVGSCEPSPLIRWDKTGSTWHTDVGKVGRYSVRRTGKRMPYGAFLNNKPIAVDGNSDVNVVKRSVERRIIMARRINETA